ncbi:MAG: hypothetical protein ACHQ1F_05125 [Spirochaetia bacterium]
MGQAGKRRLYRCEVYPAISRLPRRRSKTDTLAHPGIAIVSEQEQRFDLCQVSQKPPRARAGDKALDEPPACHRIQAGKWSAKRKKRDNELDHEKHKVQAGSPFCMHIRNMRVQIGGNLLRGYRFTLTLYEHLREGNDST